MLLLWRERKGRRLGPWEGVYREAEILARAQAAIEAPYSSRCDGGVGVVECPWNRWKVALGEPGVQTERSCRGYSPWLLGLPVALITRHGPHYRTLPLGRGLSHGQGGAASKFCPTAVTAQLCLWRELVEGECAASLLWTLLSGHRSNSVQDLFIIVPNYNTTGNSVNVKGQLVTSLFLFLLRQNSHWI